MILILTTEAGDYSHKNIVDWLKYYGADYLILTGESIYRGINKVYIKDNDIYVNNINLTKNVSIVFNRRWISNRDLPKITDDEILNKGLKNSIIGELYEFRQFLHYSLDALWIPSISSTNVNKLSVLEQAKKHGIDVPSYLVTNSKKELQEFCNNYQRVITKAIGNYSPTFTNEGVAINPIFTKLITDDIIDTLPNTFFLSLLQEYIDKEEEYRILFFYDKFYVVELLSQEISNTTIDSRNVDNASNIRMIKRDIPSNLKSKLNNLMKELNLNIGCIDMILSNNKFYFLEVNPVGQISGYSKKTAINFEKELVEYMIEYDKNRKKN